MIEPTPLLTPDQNDGAPKLHTIAAKLDLSVATVSRALRRVRGINAETRARVFAMAAQLGYQPPQSYRSQDLDQGNLQHVGVLIQAPQTHTAAPLYLIGMSEAANGLNASLVVHYVSPDRCEQILNPKFQPRAMQSGIMAGVIFVFRWPTDVVREINRRFRAVSIMNRYADIDMDLVGVDNYEGIDLLVDHLHGLGHRRIGFMGKCPELHWATQRFGGYVGALSRLGLEYQPKWVVEMDLAAITTNQSSAVKYLAEPERLTRHEGVTAWICSTETLGQQLYKWMTARGLRVPEDVSLTGFHRSDIMDPQEVQLTSVTASYQAMGAAALKRLLYRIQNPAETRRYILFPFELFNGTTTASPSNAEALPHHISTEATIS